MNVTSSAIISTHSSVETSISVTTPSSTPSGMSSTSQMLTLTPEAVTKIMTSSNLIETWTKILTTTFEEDNSEKKKRLAAIIDKLTLKKPKEATKNPKEVSTVKSKKVC